MRRRLLWFTFTEMMVVIAVATIILTMGVEHGIKSRAKAAGSTCFSNMGQMAVANAAYMADWKNFLPRAESEGADVKKTDGTEKSGTTGYPYRLERYMGGNIDAFKCLSASDVENPGNAGKYIGISDDREITYTIICNGQIIFSTEAGSMEKSFYLHAARIPQGTDKAIFLEASDVFVKEATDYNYSVTKTNDLDTTRDDCRFGARHNNEGSVAFLDGHAEMLSADLLSDNADREEWVKHHIQWWNDTSHNNPPW